MNIRTAWTNTLTRPNYTDIIPLAYYSGPALSVMWRNQDLTPGRSNNRDFSINFNQSRLGFLGLSYFTNKAVEEETGLDTVSYVSKKIYPPK